MKNLTVDLLKENEVSRLWSLVLAGDRLAFQQLAESTYNLMFQYGQKFSRDRELVKDAIQDVFLEILEKRTSLSRDIPPRPYLLACLRRRLHRLEQRQRHLLPGDPIVEGLEFNVEFSSEHYFIQSEHTRGIAEQLAALMRELPKRQKEVVYLRFFQDLDRDEIADLMDIRPQSVSNLLQSAFKWLKGQWRPVVSVMMAAFIS